MVLWLPTAVDGVPAYAGCINNLVYQENVRQRVREDCAVGCKGLHVDCANGLMGILGRHGGCYCKYCMTGFKKFLIRKYSRQKFLIMGIDNIDTWDFAAEVKRATGTKQRLLEVIKSSRVREMRLDLVFYFDDNSSCV